MRGQRVTRTALSPVGLPTTMHSVVGRVHSRLALLHNSILALTQLGVITDTCRWTLPVPLTPLPLRSDASRRSGRGSVRVPSGPRPWALPFFGPFGWGGAHRLSVSRPQRCCPTLCASSAFLSPSSPSCRVMWGIALCLTYAAPRLLNAPGSPSRHMAVCSLDHQRRILNCIHPLIFGCPSLLFSPVFAPCFSSVSTPSLPTRFSHFRPGLPPKYLRKVGLSRHISVFHFPAYFSQVRSCFQSCAGFGVLQLQTFSRSISGV